MPILKLNGQKRIEVVNLYKQGIKVDAIAVQYGVGTPYVCKLARKFGVERRMQRKRRIDYEQSRDYR